MSELKLSGKIFKILKKEVGTSKTGKEWQKLDFVIETEGKYPKKVSFTLFGDNIDLIFDKKEGDEVNVLFNAESREYKDRWFTGLTAYSVTFVNLPVNDVDTSGGGNFARVEDAKIVEPEGSDQDLPF